MKKVFIHNHPSEPIQYTIMRPCSMEYADRFIVVYEDAYAFVDCRLRTEEGIKATIPTLDFRELQEFFN
jgi:hypothetical protein